MNTFNRILGVLLALAAMTAAAGVFVAALRVIAPAQLGAAGSAIHLFDWANRPGPVAAGAAAVFLAGLALLAAELATAGRGRRQRVMVKDDEWGTVSVTMDGIEELVTREARRVGGVRDVRSRVAQDKGGLRIVERVAVAPEASVPEVSRELQERIRSVVEHYVGRPVSEVRVDARLARTAKPRTGPGRAA